MPVTESRVPSKKAGRYLAQLCKHFAHKVPVDWDETQAEVDFGFGNCRMRPIQTNSASPAAPETKRISKE